MRIVLAISLGVLFGCGTFANALILDQVSPTGVVSYNMDASTLTWQQEVTVGLAGPLEQIDLYVQKPGTAQVFVNAGAPWQSDTHDFVTTFTTGLSFAWVPIDTSSAGLNFNVGDKFVIGIKGTDGGMNLRGTYLDPGGEYPGGKLWLNGSIHSPGDPGFYDIGFRTYVPEPATLTMLGLAGLALLKRRRSA